MEIEIKETKTIWSGELQSLIEQSYGRSFRYLKGIRGKENESYLRVDVPELDAEALLPDQPEGHRLKEWLASDENRQEECPVPLSILVSDLYFKRLIPAGSYLIDIWW